MGSDDSDANDVLDNLLSHPWRVRPVPAMPLRVALSPLLYVPVPVYEFKALLGFSIDMVDVLSEAYTLLRLYPPP